MNAGSGLILGAGLGAGLMYLLDPERGRRRRALLRDQVVHAAHKTADGVDATSRDVANRAYGLAAGLWSRQTPEQVDDVVLVERVKAKLGFLVSHPGAIEVTAENGLVTLSGPVLADEVGRLLTGVSAVRGVDGVLNRLRVHRRPEDVPGLQGSPPSPRDELPEFRQAHWSPTARLVASVGGGVLVVTGARLGGPLGGPIAGAGLALLGRGLTNLELKRLVGVGAGRRAVDVQKTINIAAPVEEVFRFWTRYENFPRFMAHVREVRDAGGGRSHWTVAGPGGLPVEFDAMVTTLVPNQLVAWKTVRGSPFASSGVVRFQPNPDGGTRLDIKLSYNPPAGALGHVVAALFGADPKHAMDDDLVRLKSLLEYGKASAHGHEVRREDLVAAAPRRADGSA